jgi:hypothetical protein
MGSLLWLTRMWDGLPSSYDVYSAFFRVRRKRSAGSACEPTLFGGSSGYLPWIEWGYDEFEQSLMRNSTGQ